MTPEDRRDLTRCIEEGIKRALAATRLIEEQEHPLTGDPVATKQLARFKVSALYAQFKRKAKRSGRRACKATAAIALAACALTLGACAGTQRIAPRFTAPSVAPVQQAIRETSTHIAGAQAAVDKLAAECATKNAGWQAAYDGLQKELNDAYLSAKIADDRATGLQTQVTQLTSDANKVADGYNKAQEQIRAVEASRHGWVKRFWLAAGVATAAVGVLIGPILIKFLPFI